MLLVGLPHVMVEDLRDDRRVDGAVQRLCDETSVEVW